MLWAQAGTSSWCLDGGEVLVEWWWVHMEPSYVELCVGVGHEASSQLKCPIETACGRVF